MLDEAARFRIGCCSLARSCEAALSPDGRRLEAVHATTGSRSWIGVRNPRTTIPIPGPGRRLTQPAWSPDGAEPRRW